MTVHLAFSILWFAPRPLRKDQITIRPAHAIVENLVGVGAGVDTGARNKATLDSLRRQTAAYVRLAALVLGPDFVGTI